MTNSFKNLHLYLIYKFREFSLIIVRMTQYERRSRGLFRRVPCTSYQSQGRTLNTSACWILVLHNQEKLNSVRCWMGQHFTHMETEQDQLSYWAWSPITRGSLLAAHAVQLDHVDPSWAAVKWPHSLWMEDRHSRGVGQVPYDVPG